MSRLLAAALAVSAGACESSTPAVEDDGDAAGEFDAEPEAEPDVDPDAEPDVGPEAEPDVEPEAEPDVEPDVEPEAEADGAAAENGSPCVHDSDCRSRLCLPPALGGICAAACDSGESCGYSNACAPFARDTNGDGRTDAIGWGCVAWDPGAGYTGMTCSADGECRSGICRGGICTVRCDGDFDCEAMATCGSTEIATDDGPVGFSACGFSPVTTPQVVQVELPSQVIPTGAEGRTSVFWVPPGAVSLTLTARQSGSIGGYVGFSAVVDPAGERIYDYDSFVDGSDPPNWHIPDSRLGDFFVPMSPRVTLLRGRYVYTPVFFPPDGTTSFRDTIGMTAYVKFDPGGAVSGRLAANLFFVGSDSLTAAGAPGSTRFQNALGEWQTIFGNVGITVGDFTYTDITGTAASTYRVVDYGDDLDNGEVGGAMALSAGRTEWAVNVFFVHGFAGWELLGIAGGIPGPPAIHGTTHSGVIVCLDCAWDWGGAFIGQVVAHEVGHYLGLFHSTERPDGSYPYGGDPIADTSEGDTGNVMFWQAAGGRNLSTGQGSVIRRSPVVVSP